MPRYEERVAIGSVLQLLKTQETSITPRIEPEPNGRNKAPDYLIIFGHRKAWVEIRSSGEGFEIRQRSDGLVIFQRNDRSLTNMLGIIKIIAENFLTSEETIILTILDPIPLEKRGPLGKVIAKKLENSYINKLFCSAEGKEFQVDVAQGRQLSLHAKLSSYYAGREEYSALKVLLCGSLQSPRLSVQSCLDSQARFVLKTALEEKERKLLHLSGEKWLVIINDIPVLNEYDYRKAYAAMVNEEAGCAFSRIFVIENGAAFELGQSRAGDS